MTNEEKVEVAKARIAARKAMLEKWKETSSTKNAAENDTSNMSVQKRLERIGTKTEDPATKIVAKETNKPMGLDKAAKQMNRNEEERKKIGLDPRQPFNKKEDELGKGKKEEEKEIGQNKEQEKSNDAKKQELAAKIKLPSGMEIHQEGPAWVIVSKDGKQRNDITHAMNTIENYNHTVDEANKTAEAQNKVEDASSKAVDQNNNLQQDNAEASLTQGAKDNSITQTAPEVSDIRNEKINDVAQALPEYKDFEFAQEDIKTIATFAIDHFTEIEKNQKEADTRAEANERKRSEAMIRQHILKEKGKSI